MTSTFTPNIGLEQPSAGSYQDTWATPVNADWALIDNCFGGTSTINVTGIASGLYALTLQQFQPRNIEISGTLSGNVGYVLPGSVGGTWSIFNNTTGAYNVTLYYQGGGGYIALQQGQRTLVVGDGANLSNADTAFPNAAAANAQAAAESYAAAQAAAAQTNAETYAAAQAATAQSNAETYAAAQASAAQSNAETYAAAQASAAQSAAISTSEAYSRSLYRAGTFTAINGVQAVTFSTPFAAGVVPIVVTQWNYANPNVGWVTPGSITNTGFSYTNSNGGTCDYHAYVAN